MKGYKEVPCYRLWTKGNKAMILMKGGLYQATITHKFKKRKRR